MDESKLKKYVRTNIVDAAPMTRGEYNAYRGWAPVYEDPDEEGYILFYRKGKPDEYISWCPKKQFDEVSHLADSMTFGEAIEAMKQGHKVARKGWNGKSMFLVFQPGSEVVGADMRNEPARTFYGQDRVRICGHIDMKAADGSYVVGWLASQTDMLSNDWCIID